MLSIDILPLFLAAAIALALTPGPDMAFTLATSASRGSRAGLAAVAGIIAGGAVWTIAAAAGLAAIVAASEQALTVIKYAGAGYLIWLAIQTVRKIDALPVAKAGDDAGRAFRQGLLTNLLNPKIGLFFLALLPQFTNPEIGPVWLQMLTLGGIFFALGTIVLTVVAILAGKAQEKLVGSKTWRRTLNGLAATAFGGLGLRLLLDGDHG